jgi:hypothetical protein
MRASRMPRPENKLYYLADSGYILQIPIPTLPLYSIPPRFDITCGNKPERPLGLPTSSGRMGISVSQSLSPSRKTILCSVPFSYFVLCMAGCFPPGRRFIRFATRASLALHACPLELSNANTPISPGKALLKMAMASEYGGYYYHHYYYFLMRIGRL